MIERVKITYMGKLAEVDSDQVKKLRRKEELVKEALELKNVANSLSATDHAYLASQIAAKIIRLNRTIRNTVRFV